ncbi:MAG TPA: helix-turn-helix transcriptional regulator [Puia sp.]
MSLFSKNLRFLRKKGNHNQDEISLLFNKRANTIGNWENQKSEPSLAELMKLGEYFKVSIQDLLHTDLEAFSFHHNAERQYTETSEQNIKSYPLQEPIINVANEGSQDAFWIILKELRAVNEKVDLLVSRMEPTAYKKNSDKSYH